MRLHLSISRLVSPTLANINTTKRCQIKRRLIETSDFDNVMAAREPLTFASSADILFSVSMSLVSASCSAFRA